MRIQAGWAWAAAAALVMAAPAGTVRADRDQVTPEDMDATGPPPDPVRVEEQRRAGAAGRRTQQVNQIIRDYREQRLDAAAARKRLLPLVQAQAEEETGSADRKIASLRQEIAELELMKRNARQWAQKRVDQLMGPEAGR